MIKNIIYFSLSFFILSSCNLSSSNSVSNVKNENTSQHKTYSSYNEYIIPLMKMYNMNDAIYAVYFYSEYCPACASLKDDLFNFIDEKNKSVENMYLVDIGTTKEEEFKKLKSTNGMNDEEILSNTIGASKIEETYFRSSPCIYIISKIDNKNIVKNYYFNYSDVESFLKNI